MCSRVIRRRTQDVLGRNRKPVGSMLKSAVPALIAVSPFDNRRLRWVVS
jgi:hypothetical protein